MIRKLIQPGSLIFFFFFSPKDQDLVFTWGNMAAGSIGLGYLLSLGVMVETLNRWITKGFSTQLFADIFFPLSCGHHQHLRVPPNHKHGCVYPQKGTENYAPANGWWSTTHGVCLCCLDRPVDTLLPLKYKKSLLQFIYWNVFYHYRLKIQNHRFLLSLKIAPLQALIRFLSR